MARDPRRIEVLPICHPRGCRSYVAIDPRSREAAVIDPLLEHLKETLDVLSEHRASLRWIVETHAHGDHLSGAAALAKRTNAPIVAHPAHPLETVDRRAADGTRLPLGEAALIVRHAPGVSQDALVLEGPGAYFTGDVLLIGTVGLRDAPGADGEAWYQSLRRIFDPLDESIVLHPGHDDVGRTMTTMRAERTGNRWLREDDRIAWLDLFQADDRKPSPEAARILEANRSGLERVEKRLAQAGGFQSPVEREAAERRERRRPLDAPEAAPRPPVQVGGMFLVAMGLLAALGPLLGWGLKLPLLHGLSLVAGLGLLAVGLPRLAHKKPKGGAAEDLFYEGAPREGIAAEPQARIPSRP